MQPPPPLQCRGLCYSVTDMGAAPGPELLRDPRLQSTGGTLELIWGLPEAVASRTETGATGLQAGLQGLYVPSPRPSFSRLSFSRVRDHPL